MARKYQRKTPKTRLRELRQRDMRFHISVTDNDWLCPYCAKIGVHDKNAGKLLDLIMAHIRQCPDANNLRAEPMPEAQLERAATLLGFSRMITREPAFRIFAKDQRWLCPYCGVFTAFDHAAAARDASDLDLMVNNVRKHFQGCPAYAQDRQNHKSLEELKVLAAQEDRRETVASKIVAIAQSQPIFKYKTRNHLWVCPYCLDSVSYIDMSSPLLAEHTAPRQMARHILSECRTFAAGERTTKSESQLQAALERHNAALPEDIQAAGADTQYLKDMKAELSALRGQIDQNKELQKSLDRAQKAQSRMLPKEPPSIAGYEFAAYYKASEMISGDFYDFVDLKNNRVGIVIGDVSGHGIEAGLVMGMTKKAFEIRAGTGNSPAKVLTDVNSDIFPDLEQGTFVTAFYALLDANKHTIHYARAGHNFSLLFTPSTNHLEMLKSNGLMLGANKGPLFEKALQELHYDLKPGQVFLQYTDGVTEAMNAKHDEFEFDRLCQALAKHGAGTAQQVIDGIFQAMEEFTKGHPQEDDITLLCLRRTAPDRATISRTKEF